MSSIKKHRPFNGDLASTLLRHVSCTGEPSENALSFVLNNDLNQLTNLLAEHCPISDDSTVVEDGTEFPLPLDHWINTPFGPEHEYKTLLELAVESDSKDIVQSLLASGANAGLYNELTGKSPIHVAVENNNLSLVKSLLEDFVKKPKINKANINAIDDSGQTPLHLAAQKGQIKILRYLLDHQDLANVDPKDLNGGRTPLFLAAKAKQAECCEALIASGASLETRCFNRAVKEVLKETMPYFDPFKIDVSPKRRSNWNVADHLVNLLHFAQRNAVKRINNSQNLLEFKIYLQHVGREELDTIDAGGMTLFQKGCEYGLHDHVQVMLEAGINPRGVSSNESSDAVLLACYNGFYLVLEQLIDHKIKGGKNPTNFAVTERLTLESCLHWVLKKPSWINDPRCNYEECFNLLLEKRIPEFNYEIERIVNHKDAQLNTPLHYATQLWKQSHIRQLLERGANIGMRNNYEEVPISLISPETMEDFLNDFCIRSKNDVTHDDFELQFDYSFLAPPVDDPIFDETDPEGQELVAKQALPETETLWHMSRSKEHRHLLHHPVIMSFLWLKWQRIRGYFNRNLRFYLMFFVSLSWYIFERFGGLSSRMTENPPNASFCSELSDRKEPGIGFWYLLFLAHAILQGALILRDWKHDCLKCNVHTTFQMIFTSWMEALTTGMIICLLYFRSQALWTVLTILLGLLMLREVFQMTGSLKRYLVSPENWLEMIMIALVGVILWAPDESMEEPCEVKRHLAAVAIILSWAELITLVARHPKLARYNVYVTMFYKVLQTFLFFLLWYSFFIVAFGFGFYIMLHQDIGKEGDQDSDYPFFDRPWLALMKTSTMFVGEIEFSDIPIIQESWKQYFGYCFLLTFIFLIVVVLMNLLNGLAVSDTGMIQEKAEAVSAISRVETISYIESLLLGDPFDFLSEWPPIKWLKSMPSMALCRCMFKSSTVRDLSFKVTGATGILLFYSMLPTKQLTLYPNKRNASCLSISTMSEDALVAAKKIVVQRRERQRQLEEEDGAKEKQELILDRMLQLEKKVDRLLQSLQSN